MKSVLISIQPKWCEKIANGDKTIEVRKSKPKIETPFKCYIYCTNRPFDITDIQDLNVESVKKTAFGRGKVIGEFVCDKIVKFENSFYEPAFEETSYLSCVGYDELAKYFGNNDYGYGWHISDLKIYDKPKELSEFKKPCDRFLDCITCKRLVRNDFLSCDNIITRPPQSWCYVESLGE
jgi:predicted transcriptional regulator